VYATVSSRPRCVSLLRSIRSFLADLPRDRDNGRTLFSRRASQAHFHRLLRIRSSPVADRFPRRTKARLISPELLLRSLNQHRQRRNEAIIIKIANLPNPQAGRDVINANASKRIRSRRTEYYLRDNGAAQIWKRMPYSLKIPAADTNEENGAPSSEITPRSATVSRLHQR